MSAESPFELPPEEAIRWFRQKGYALNFDWRDMWREQHARAFTVAKATQLDILADIRAELDKAIASGATLRTFAKALKPTLQAKGWWGEKEVIDPKTGEKVLAQLGSATRLRTIYDTNLRQAQSAGRYERMQRTKARRPYARYVCVDDGNTRAEHWRWHGLVLPIDDPFWDTHWPPNGWGCRCKVMQLSDRDLERYGFKVGAAPAVETVTYVNERTGQRTRVPKGIDPSFDYNPGKVPRGFTPPDNAPVLRPVRSFADYDRPALRDVPAEERQPQPDLWPAVHTRADERRVREAFAQLFQIGDKQEAEVGDPQGVQTTFNRRFLDHLLEKDPTRTSFVPLAKTTVERPFEIWMVPFRRKDGSVVMRKRYIGLYEGAKPDAGHLVVVDRGDDGQAAWTAYPKDKLDSKREGYLLYPATK